MASRSTGLEALLDDALEDFVLGSESREGGAEESGAQEGNGREEGPATSGGVPRSPSPTPRLSQPSKSMAFDPLGRKTGSAKGKGRKPVAKQSASSAQMQATEQPNQTVAGTSMSQLLSELAQAAQVSHASQPSGQSTDAHLSSTLRALADQTPSSSMPGEGGVASHAGTSQDEKEVLEQLTAQLQAAFQNEPGQGTDEGELPGMSSLVDTIMQQLLSKDVLYQPMKDIGSRYPEWIEAHKDELSSEDITRYKEQYQYIQRICILYETNPKDYPQLMDLLHEMQQRGQPPQEIIDELAPGMTFGPDGLPQSPSLPGGDGDCCVQ